MTLRVDRTLPHHAALGLVLFTEPRRRPTLDDRTPDQIQRDAAAGQLADTITRTAEAPASRQCRNRPH
ncbi:hypothetical protein A7U43_27735 (plasmid) [Mycobacterium adipatum]|uniref:Uncharacterized protein n=1 Tax=Mycobacterium adipatum TaxID=1682113 RepID=A0A172UW64_9MYCO|nr:hypothetical protein [Mycobacterium adipatum]ANE83332.1 hypothetical protein A7U43_27735 [Mycobacterium adipatum]